MYKNISYTMDQKWYEIFFYTRCIVRMG
uniref:Uncharacterized protein n=1 Tax=Arundo donax TaxID=35708 RepID=A0A0A9H5J3_ARUDO